MNYGNKNKNKFLVSAFCLMLLSELYASGSSTDLLPVSEQQTNAEETLKQLREQGLIELIPFDKRRMNTFLGKDETSEPSEVKTNPILDIRFMSGQPVEESTYANNCYYVKYDGKIFVFPENSINKPSLFLQQTDDNNALRDMYLIKLQSSLDDKTLQFIPICLFKVNDRSLEETENDRINLHLTLAEQDFIPTAYVLDRSVHRRSMNQLLANANSKDFRYLSIFYFMNMAILRNGLSDNVDHFMSLIKGRSYTDAKPMPDLFPYINQYAAINLLRTDPDFFLKHLNQFFTNEDIRKGDDYENLYDNLYANLYAILNDKETSVEEKIRRIEAI